MTFEERAIHFFCGDVRLFGILSVPEQVTTRGVLILVGGPQYRVGSHRQFTLLARQLAKNGFPAMRFDYRGMGDSEGEQRNFEAIDEDIDRAIDHFFEQVTGMTEVVIWGLCDAASASLFYAHKDPRVSGIVLLNPWVRTEKTIAKVYVKHYYLNRLFEQEFWRKVLHGRLNILSAGRSFVQFLVTAFFWHNPAHSSQSEAESLSDRMLCGLKKFKGKVLLILSGKDLTSKEFMDLVQSSSEWQSQLSITNMTRLDLHEANHTFAQREWRDQVADATIKWVQSW
jgi:exosortase A-associated hydrolase 1